MSHADDVYFEDATKREQSQNLQEHCSESNKNYRGCVASNGIEAIIQKKKSSGILRQIQTCGNINIKDCCVTCMFGYVLNDFHKFVTFRNPER